MFNVGDYVYANIQLEFDINIVKNPKPIIHHGIIIDVIQFGESCGAPPFLLLLSCFDLCSICFLC